MKTADAGDYEAPTLDAPETAANPVAEAGDKAAETFDVEPREPPPPTAEGQVEAL